MVKKIYCLFFILFALLFNCKPAEKPTESTSDSPAPKAETGVKKQNKSYKSNWGVAYQDKNYFYELTEIPDPDNSSKKIYAMNYKGVMPEYTVLELIDEIQTVKYPNVPGDPVHLAYESDFLKAEFKDDNGKSQAYWFIKGQVYSKTLIGIVSVEDIAYSSNSEYEVTFNAVPVSTIVLIDAESKDNKRLKGTFTAINESGMPYVSPVVYFDPNSIDFSEDAVEAAKVVNSFKRMEISGQERLVIIDKILKDYGADNKFMKPLLDEKAVLESSSGSDSE